ncbi:unnamed protein product [Polarella glacialis]|uniref:Uncharacterized protein n=1 Tax=Polarella glacialis TaxID=89957 RepID=A0A813HQZ2_POLGL|nr:unnamed protein product [Polarella glacialis]
MAAHPEAADKKFPVTGFARDNLCGSHTGDGGSHYVCAVLPSSTTSAGGPYSEFWTKTGQARSGEEAVTWPKPGPWCICMWAFARMYGNNPEFSEMLDCSATNYWVVQKYDINKPAECRALAAVCNRCDLQNSTLTKREGIQKKCEQAQQLCPSEARTMPPRDWPYHLVVVVVAVVVVVILVGSCAQCDIMR